MFGHKNKKLNNDQELITKINQDLIVRNMPSLTRPSDPVSASSLDDQSTNSVLSNMGQPKHNFKMVGLIIIGGGLLLIGGLVYLSYIYIIKPQASKAPTVFVAPEPTKSIVDTINEIQATASEPIIIATTSEVTIATTTELATTTASSSLIMNEELNGKQNTDLPPLLDSDADGLNDEEELVLGTNAQLADSNNNTYSDLIEINNSYDPAGKGKISGNVNLTKYINKTIGYEILYPKKWTQKSLNDDSTIIFTAPDDSIIQISVQENLERQSILGWYSNAFPDIVVTYDKLKTIDNWDGIMGDDSLNFYLTDKKHKNVYVISYLPAVSERFVYPNIFKLMINSLVIK